MTMMVSLIRYCSSHDNIQFLTKSIRSKQNNVDLYELYECVENFTYIEIAKCTKQDNDRYIMIIEIVYDGFGTIVE